MKNSDKRSVNIRAIQHFLYCPRRFGLLEINGDWAENASVVRANIIHEHVHSGDRGACRNGYSMTAVTLWWWRLYFLLYVESHPVWGV